MGKMIIELQKDIVNPNIDIETLLLKAYLIAKKLKLTDFEAWLNHELTGYPSDVVLPEYREVIGIPVAFNSIEGWQIADENMPRDLTALLYEVFSKFPMKHSISNIMSLISSHGTTVDLMLSPKLFSDMVLPNIEKISLRVGKNYLEEILSKIRKVLLDWTIELESNNILGEDFEFSLEERSRANEPEIKNYTVHIYGNNNQVQQETWNSEQSFQTE